jgi:hypothetical protein
MRVFWSWQRDVFPKSCRHFIRAALQQALEVVASDLSIDDANRPELDHDTRGEAGMVDIADVILSKIASSAAFVADLTPIGVSETGKALPNPNVCIELGWAMQKPGIARVIGVLNSASGFKPEHLPFDINHRRVISYTLKDDDTAETRTTVKKQLVSQLTGALKANLSAHLDEVAAATTIAGVEARKGTPSIWASATDPLRFRDDYTGGAFRFIPFPDTPRGYVRIIPSGWKDGPPSIHDIESLSHDAAVWAPSTGGSSGDFGASPEGYVRFWHTGFTEERHPITTNVARYFAETGEFWVVHGTAISDPPNAFLYRDALVRCWYHTMRRSFVVFDQFGASRVRKVEVGVTGLTDVRIHVGFVPRMNAVALIGTCQHSRQNFDWSEAARLEFLAAANNRVLNLFGQPRETQIELCNLIGITPPSAPTLQTPS